MQPDNHPIDADPQETQEWLDAMEAVNQARGNGACPLSSGTADRQGAPIRGLSPLQADHRLPEHHSGRGRGAEPRRFLHRVAYPLAGALERPGHGAAGEPEEHRTGRPHRQLRVRRDPVRRGFNHFWRAPTPDHGGDLVYIQGHSAPGVYARAYLEGRLGEDDLDSFRQEATTPGLSSYPHPWLMPNFWQFPTVSMGLGPTHGDLSGPFS